ncbi:Homeobox-leucine zipper protein family [Euphorbia peplus]|nr:Homeobox-leucine zipper protein family [Euphorbia peplus]
MGFGIPDHGVCNTGLGLGLTSCHENKETTSKSDHHHHHHHEQKKKIFLKYDHVLPCLTLGCGGDLHVEKQVSCPSAVSSFSNSSVKKESEEIDVERRMVSDEDEELGSPRKKLRLTKQQSAILEDNFKEHSTLNPKQKQALAEQLNLKTRQVEVWFQNRRARTKLKQTEVDCEVMKRCCEKLTEENKRLKKEIEELKSMKKSAGAGPGAPQLYMHLPAATLSICPTCERIASTDATSATPNSNFFTPFTHPSAACYL